MSTPEFTLKDMLETSAYLPDEIERILDENDPTFIDFDPELGYVLKDYLFHDGMEGTESSYKYHKHGGHRWMINYADQPCRINTYGDSFTQCAQVSDGETWQEVLAAHFREPMRNFGVGGYGVYTAYRTALRAEVDPELAAEYIVLNIWDDDHLRNLDAARWIRVGWMCRDIPRGGKGGYPVHGFPWAHMRWNYDKGDFDEIEGMCTEASQLRQLVGKENFYNAFKDDPVAQLYCLREGGDAPIAESEKLAEALGVTVDLRNPATRQADARRLHWVYGMRASMWIVDHLGAWCDAHGRKFMVVLSYDVPQAREYLEKGTRFDEAMVDFLANSGRPYVDALPAMAKDYADYKCSVDEYLQRLHVARAGAQVFGHYNPYGNFWFAYALRPAFVDWLNPKPPSYR